MCKEYHPHSACEFPNKLIFSLLQSNCTYNKSPCGNIHQQQAAQNIPKVLTSRKKAGLIKAWERCGMITLSQLMDLKLFVKRSPSSPTKMDPASCADSTLVVGNRW